MRRPILIAGVAAGAALLWTAGWFAGRTLYVVPEADLMVERLRAGSVFFSYSEREITGFPFSYDISYQAVTVTDSADRWRWTSPTITAAAALVEAGALVIRPAARSRLEVEPAAFGAAADGAPIAFDIVGDGVELTLYGAAEGDALLLRAKSLEATQVGGGAPINGAHLRLTGLAVDAALGVGAGSGKMDADEMEVAYQFSLDQVSETKSVSLIRDLAVVFEGAALDSDNVTDFLGAEGAFDLRIRTGAYKATGSSSGGPSQAPFAMEMTVDTSDTAIVIREGRARYATETSGVVYGVQSVTPPASLGGGAAEKLSVEMELPLRRSLDPGPYAFRLGLAGMTLDDTLWSMADPSGAFERTPFELAVEFGGDMRVIADLGAESFGQPPIDVETLEIRKARLSGLGVIAEATGALDIAGDAAQPLGEVALDIRGLLALIDKVAAAGLIPLETAALYRTQAATFGRKGDGPDHLLADIVLTRDGATINGRPLQKRP
ncbi:MAG: DUF2125 domain-containing protein, partial [Paracoccaceae bacterium]